MTTTTQQDRKLAVGARVILRRNIDIKAGLVNGVIGTILEVYSKGRINGFNNCQSVDEYVQKSKDSTWVLTLNFAHLTKTCVFLYTK